MFGSLSFSDLKQHPTTSTQDLKWKSSGKMCAHDSMEPCAACGVKVLVVLPRLCLGLLRTGEWPGVRLPLQLVLSSLLVVVLLSSTAVHTWKKHQLAIDTIMS